jgi:hypothetical protein
MEVFIQSVRRRSGKGNQSTRDVTPVFRDGLKPVFNH